MLKIFNDVMGKIINKVYFPFVDKIFPMNDIQEAHKHIIKRNHTGKVVVNLD